MAFSPTTEISFDRCHCRKRTLPLGPYVFAISVTSPFIKFKNASKETIDGSEAWIAEILRTFLDDQRR